MECQEDAKNQIKRDLLDYYNTIHSLSSTDFKESLDQMKLLIINPRQTFQIQQWNYEIQIRQPNNMSFLILLLIVQIVMALCLRIFYIPHNFIIIICKMLIQSIFHIIFATLLLKKYVEKQRFSIVFVLQVLFHSYFLFTLYNYCVMFLLSPLIKYQYILPNLLNLYANYQYYYSVFKQISGVNIIKQSEYLLLPIGLQFIIFLALSILQLNYFEIQITLLN